MPPKKRKKADIAKPEKSKKPLKKMKLANGEAETAEEQDQEMAELKEDAEESKRDQEKEEQAEEESTQEEENIERDGLSHKKNRKRKPKKKREPEIISYSDLSIAKLLKEEILKSKSEQECFESTLNKIKVLMKKRQFSDRGQVRLLWGLLFDGAHEFSNREKCVFSKGILYDCLTNQKWEIIKGCFKALFKLSTMASGFELQTIENLYAHLTLRVFCEDSISIEVFKAFIQHFKPNLSIKPYNLIVNQRDELKNGKHYINGIWESLLQNSSILHRQDKLQTLIKAGIEIEKELVLFIINKVKLDKVNYDAVVYCLKQKHIQELKEQVFQESLKGNCDANIIVLLEELGFRSENVDIFLLAELYIKNLLLEPYKKIILEMSQDAHYRKNPKYRNHLQLLLTEGDVNSPDYGKCLSYFLTEQADCIYTLPKDILNHWDVKIYRLRFLPGNWNEKDFKISIPENNIKTLFQFLEQVDIVSHYDISEIFKLHAFGGLEPNGNVFVTEWFVLILKSYLKYAKDKVSAEKPIIEQLYWKVIEPRLYNDDKLLSFFKIAEFLNYSSETNISTIIKIVLEQAKSLEISKLFTDDTVGFMTSFSNSVKKTKLTLSRNFTDGLLHQFLKEFKSHHYPLVIPLIKIMVSLGADVKQLHENLNVFYSVYQGYRARISENLNALSRSNEIAELQIFEELLTLGANPAVVIKVEDQELNIINIIAMENMRASPGMYVEHQRFLLENPTFRHLMDDARTRATVDAMRRGMTLTAMHKDPQSTHRLAVHKTVSTSASKLMKRYLNMGTDQRFLTSNTIFSQIFSLVKTRLLSEITKIYEKNIEINIQESTPSKEEIREHRKAFNRELLSILPIVLETFSFNQPHHFIKDIWGIREYEAFRFLLMCRDVVEYQRWVDPTSNVTLKEAIVCIWLAIHDQNYYPNTDDRNAGINELIISFSQIQRNYNLSSSNENVGVSQLSTDAAACIAGAFNLIISTLDGTTHPDVKINQIGGSVLFDYIRDFYEEKFKKLSISDKNKVYKESHLHQSETLTQAIEESNMLSPSFVEQFKYSFYMEHKDDIVNNFITIRQLETYFAEPFPLENFESINSYRLQPEPSAPLSQSLAQPQPSYLHLSLGAADAEGDIKMESEKKEMFENRKYMIQPDPSESADMDEDAEKDAKSGKDEKASKDEMEISEEEALFLAKPVQPITQPAPVLYQYRPSTQSSSSSSSSQKHFPTKP